MVVKMIPVENCAVLFFKTLRPLLVCAAASPAMGGLLRGSLALLPSPGKRRHGLSAVHRLFHGRVFGDVISQGCAYREPPHQPARAAEANTESAGWQRVHGKKKMTLATIKKKERESLILGLK